MASGQINRLACLFSRVYPRSNLRHLRDGCLVSASYKSTLRGPAIDQNCNVEIGVTSDGKTVVCYHPTVDVPYELTQPIPRPDPVSGEPESHEQILKAHLSKDVLKDKQAPTIEELSKMFYTTKHRWYPVGQYHTRRRKRDPPKDR
ncbi:large ribosomal subunit protein mL42 [Chanos chanos]|uniref:Large ribosomal subunit protein mL42 n=1 Tax=Chanos chanos TaxID=29144 RepID=A0A6J2WFR6_CHACN|nr:39S ribosomal protein L42, mitochondrial [Chanos chanos]